MNSYKIHKNLSHNDCFQAINSFKDIISNYVPSYSSVGDTRFFGFERFIDSSITRILFDLDSNFIYSHTKKKPVFQTLMMNHTYYHDTAKGSGEGWHRDSCLKKQFKTIFYLVPVSSSNGPFRVFINPRKLFNIIFKFKRRFSNEFVTFFSFLLRDESLFTSTSHGHGFSINTNLIHRGSKIISGERFAITVYSYLDEPDETIFKLSNTDLKPL
ncbi:hypothetical protein N9J83_09625 [Opitutales bacterium]|nr:hypothetical protein [Opitutales bacterium]